MVQLKFPVTFGQYLELPGYKYRMLRTYVLYVCACIIIARLGRK